MFVILCENYREAVNSFWISVAILQENEPDCLKMLDEFSNCILTCDDLSYYFIDHRFRNLPCFNHKGITFMDVHDFFVDMPILY